jgi:hypothetical protein
MKEMELFDSKLCGGAEATKAAVKLAKQEETTEAWIFGDN